MLRCTLEETTGRFSSQTSSVLASLELSGTQRFFLTGSLVPTCCTETSTLCLATSTAASALPVLELLALLQTGALLLATLSLDGALFFPTLLLKLTKPLALRNLLLKATKH